VAELKILLEKLSVTESAVTVHGDFLRGAVKHPSSYFGEP